jgi:uncharacterized protein
MLDESLMKSIFHDCRQCGTCCKAFSKIKIYPEEVDFIKKMGGHVGIQVNISELIQKNINDLINEPEYKDKLYMVHPDSKGCIFLEQRNNNYYCKIYHYRPKTCQGFKCNLVDEHSRNLLFQDAIYLLGEDKYGFKLNP